MKSEARASLIRDFVRTTLGCSCPDEVFLHIEYREGVSLPECRTCVTTILIGQRLLVFVVGADQATDIEHELPVVVRHGKRERDRHGYNRFRLVVATDDPAETRTLAAVRAIGDDLDEKAHLHVVSREAVKTLYATDASPG